MKDHFASCYDESGFPLVDGKAITRRRFLREFGAYSLGAAAIVCGGCSLFAKKAKLGHGLPREHPQGESLEKFAALVSEYTSGHVELTVEHGGKLGSDAAMIKATQFGSQEFYWGSMAPLADRDKALQVFDLPFMFRNIVEVEAVLNGTFGQTMLRLLEPRNLLGLGWAEVGFRQLSNAKRPVKTAKDLVGLDIRVMQNQLAVDTWRALGVNPVPLAFGEVYGLLKKGSLDGQENPLIHMYANKMYEVQKYCTITNHVYTPAALLVSSRFMKSLSESDQDGIKRAATDAIRFHSNLMANSNKEVVQKLTAKGMEIVQLPESEIEVLRRSVAPVVDQYSDIIGREYLDKLNSEIALLRKPAK